MYRDPYTDEPIETDEQTYTLLVLREWTNQVLDRVHDVPESGVDIAAERAVFYAWDAPQGPETCLVVAVPSDWQDRASNKPRVITWTTESGTVVRRKVAPSATQQMLRFGRLVAQHVAQPDGAPTPIMDTVASDPTVPAKQPIL